MMLRYGLAINDTRIDPRIHGEAAPSRNKSTQITVPTEQTTTLTRMLPHEQCCLARIRSSRERPQPYHLMLPADHSRRGSRRWPLLLFLHGAGERGTRLSAVTRHGPIQYARRQSDFPFVLVSPLCPKNEIWSVDLLHALVDHVVERWAIDPTRMYLTGLSMGGYGTWDAAVTDPERWAAVAPICGGGGTLPLLLRDPPRRPGLRRLPIWAFHGVKDEVVPCSESKRMVAAFRALGNPARLTLYPEADHDAWTRTYDNPKLYQWFLRHRRWVRIAARSQGTSRRGP
jgi:predicted peptidase